MTFINEFIVKAVTVRSYMYVDSLKCSLVELQNINVFGGNCALQQKIYVASYIMCLLKPNYNHLAL